MERSTKHFRKRDAILACLRATDTHPCADWVYQQVKAEIPNISLGTVYRNLAMFKEQGVIASLGTVNGIERFDANTSPHVHFICHQCGSVADLPQMAVPQALCAEAACQTGGKIDLCQLSFAGTCSACCQSLQKNEN